jgi:hypothetical protein
MKVEAQYYGAILDTWNRFLAALIMTLTPLWDKLPSPVDIVLCGNQWTVASVWLARQNCYDPLEVGHSVC